MAAVTVAREHVSKFPLPESAPRLTGNTWEEPAGRGNVPAYCCHCYSLGLSAVQMQPSWSEQELPPVPPPPHCIQVAGRGGGNGSRGIGRGEEGNGYFF